MNHIKKQVGIILLSMAATAVLANDVHTWHQIKVDNGQWQAKLVITSANEQAYFTDKNSVNEGDSYSFALTSAASPFVYGFGFTNADFNVSYVLTAYEVTGENTAMFAAKTCQFDVSAKGPAQPDIRVEKYNGAQCSFNIVSGVGENFEIG